MKKNEEKKRTTQTTPEVELEDVMEDPISPFYHTQLLYTSILKTLARRQPTGQKAPQGEK